MDSKRIADILEQINRKVGERWHEIWMSQSERGKELAATVGTYQPFALQGDGFFQPQSEPAVVAASGESTCESVPDGVVHGAKLIGEPKISSSVAISGYNIYPAYYTRIIDAIRADDMETFCNFMTNEGAKWALVEVPVNELVTQSLAYGQEIADLLYSDASLNLRFDERREAVRAIDALSQRASAALVKGYVDGRDRLLIRALASNRHPGENGLSPIVKGTVMGGFGEQVRRSLDELEALHKVNNAVNSSLDLDSVLNLTVQAVSEVMTVDVCSIYVFERGERGGEEQMMLRATKGLNPHAIGNVTVQLGEGVTGAAAKEGKPISVYDICADNRFTDVPPLHGDSSRSMLSVPIILFTREKLVGVINVESRSYRSWTTEETRFVEMVAGEIALAIENALLYQQTDERLKQKVQELTTLQNVSNLIAATLNLDEVLTLIVQQAAQLVKTDMASIYELKEGSQYLTIVANHGLSEDYVKHMQVKLGEGPVGRSAELNRPVNVWDAHFELHPGEEYYYNNQYRSAMCVPLAGARGVLGVICLYTHEQHHFTNEQLQIISAFADQAAIAIENARLYEAAQRGLTLKSTLLQEMHHRVRNNLQTVAALLSMQMRRSTVKEVVGPLSESVARIQSIAAVHDLLCRDDIGVTTVNAVAKEICDIAAVSLVRPDQRIRFKIDDGKVPIASKEATLLAILMMELVTNAIFHGFEDATEGEIRISAFVDEGRTQIEIRDNGQGFPPDFDLATSQTGLGLHIVQTLVTKDLQGTFRMENINNWATSTITFNSVYGQQSDQNANDMAGY